MNNFTPGPWKICKTFYGETYIEDKDGYFVCAFPECPTNKKDVVMIAAAPEMYECLKAFMYAVDTTRDLSRLLDDAYVKADALLRGIDGEEETE